MSYQIIGRYPLQKQGQRPGRPVHIYLIRDPNTGAVRYVGKTVDPMQRASAHRVSWSTSEALHTWIADCLSAGLELSLDVVEIAEPGEGDAAEVRWIEAMLAEGHNLLNEAGCPALTSRRRERRRKEQEECLVEWRLKHEVPNSRVLVLRDPR